MFETTAESVCQVKAVNYINLLLTVPRPGYFYLLGYDVSFGAVFTLLHG